MTEKPDSPGVNFPPPTLFVIATMIGVGIESVYPTPLSTLVPVPARFVLGWVAVAIGLTLMGWSFLSFIRVRTAVYPNRPATELVGGGPYRFSRNPMYVALTAITLGVALLADNVWMLISIPIVLTVLTIFVIRKEEAYLHRSFGEEYAQYFRNVRRWL